ncbi:MAG: XdhC family protein [Acidobacteria bacterium]|nr:XdhC family protein [Acidobacteriota bacterium]
MNEVRALVEAFDDANMNGQRCALATVVNVEGSSYRRPGARMLVCENGASTGTISAGCLEADVVEHAKRVIRTGAAKIVGYNTAATSDEMVWGLGLGCNGIVHVLVEPLATDSSYLHALRRSCETNAAPVIVATVCRHTPSRLTPADSQIKTGARIVIDEDRNLRSEGLSGPWAAVLESQVRTLSRAAVDSGARTLDVGGGTITVFIETLIAPVPLVIFGAGPDALPIVELARSIGWQTEVVDPQARPMTLTRFAIADHITLSRPEDVPARVTITPRTLTLLMTHNYSHDLALLKFLLDTQACYIGVMGPRNRTERMLGELTANEEILRFEETDVSRLYSPVGLDIGANTPAEVALSIVAEMRAVLEGRGGGMLRERRGSIHGRTAYEDRAARTDHQVLTLAVA